MRALINLMEQPETTGTQPVNAYLTPQTTLRMLEACNAVPPAEVVVKAEPGVAVSQQFSGPVATITELPQRNLASSLPMSAFFPLIKSDAVPEDIYTTPGYSLQILRQPPPEVTKAVCLVNCIGAVVSFSWVRCMWSSTATARCNKHYQRL